MIMSGVGITVKDDPLLKIKVEYLFHKLQHPNPDIEARIRQLRIIRQLDPKQYSVLKRQLPYIVCGIFNPSVRKSDYFAYTEYFVVDIDHIEEKELSIETLKSKFAQDKRVVLCFVSPGQDGLKLMFRLKERCYDAGIYSVFYKLFLTKFGSEYNIQQVIDTRTSDVARACFVSMDAEAYYNPEAEPVDLNQYLNTDNVSEMFRIKKEVEAKLPAVVEKKDITSSPDDAALLKIKALLRPDLKQALQKTEAFVPQQLDDVMDGLIAYIEPTGIIIKEIAGINYGKKMQFLSGIKQAEINLFWGRKGYSVVQSPRRGTNAELNQLMADLIQQYVLQIEN
ncbi:MAG: CRISPR-associated primase-polymerase type B [Paludibacter sp.]|nr:CRISPR-associated primase-polymerase type B [Paludibacter sp.]